MSNKKIARKTRPTKPHHAPAGKRAPKLVSSKDDPEMTVAEWKALRLGWQMASEHAARPKPVDPTVTQAETAPAIVPGSPEDMAQDKARKVAAREVLRDPLRTIQEGAAEIDRLVVSALVDLAGDDDYATTVHELARLARENFYIRMAAADEAQS
jgi:hypothetical protein